MKGKGVEGKMYPRKIGKRRLRYIEEKFDAFLNGLFKEGEMVEVVIKPISPTMLEVTFEEVSERFVDKDKPLRVDMNAVKPKRRGR